MSLNISKTIFVIFFNVTTGIPNEIQIDDIAIKITKQTKLVAMNIGVASTFKILEYKAKRQCNPIVQTACNIYIEQANYDKCKNIV